MKVWYAILLERSIGDMAANALFDVCGRAALQGYQRITIPYGRTDVVRNLLAADFMRQSSDPDDVLVMLDNDHVHPYDVIERLVAHGVPVVGALAYRRSEPYDPQLYGLVDGKLRQPSRTGGELVRVDLVGFGAVAIRRRAFLALAAAGKPAPWFRYDYDDGGAVFLTEDTRFCRLCGMAGVGVYCDTALVTPHVGTRLIQGDEWAEQMRLMHPIANEARERVALIVPCVRNAQAARMIEQARATAGGVPLAVVAVADGESPDLAPLQAVPGITLLVNGEQRGAVRSWNRGAAATDAPYLVLGADDLWPHPGWLTEALAEMDRLGGMGLVGFNDLHRHGDVLATHWLTSRRFCDEVLGGVLAIPAYYHYYFDPEINERAKAAGRYRWAARAVMEHRHPLAHKAAMDDLYRLTHDTHYAADKATYERRRAAGYPNDYAPAWGPTCQPS